MAWKCFIIRNSNEQSATLTSANSTSSSSSTVDDVAVSRFMILFKIWLKTPLIFTHTQREHHKHVITCRRHHFITYKYLLCYIYSYQFYWNEFFDQIKFEMRKSSITIYSLCIWIEFDRNECFYFIFLYNFFSNLFSCRFSYQSSNLMRASKFKWN